MKTDSTYLRSPFNALVIVAALGYFVDIYDLILFNIVKKESLEFLRMAGDSFQDNEIFLFNCQMAGMLIGGLIWGVLGDKRGRLSVLFGSILLYSLANIVNAFVSTVPQYASVRFLAGLGLAGELGAGITLVVESMSKETRGYGTMLIVTFGALGAVFAYWLGKEGGDLALLVNSQFGTHLVNWQMSYIVGGAMGICLLFLRMGTFESGMFQSVKESSVQRGNLMILFRNRYLLRRYINCILIGLPVWYIVGILIALCVPITAEMGLKDISTGTAVLFTYIGLSAGDLLSGTLSQLRRSRNRIVIAFITFSYILTMFFLLPISTASDWFYFICFLLGAATGYWALFITMAAELFGTNIRSTVTNTVPNFVRGSVIPLTTSYKMLADLFEGHLAYPKVISAAIVGIVTYVLAFRAIISLQESYHRDLNYSESDS